MFGGSTNWRADDDVMPHTSDLDIIIWTNDNNRGHIKKSISGLAVSASIQAYSSFAQEPEAILGDFRIACHFTVPSIIADPTGHLTYLHQVVAREYARREWVEKRCEHAHYRIIHEVLGSLVASAILADSMWDQLFELYYAVMVTAEIFALAELRNPTIRKSLVVSRDILQARNQLEMQEALLGVLGIADSLATFSAFIPLLSS